MANTTSWVITKAKLDSRHLIKSANVNRHIVSCAFVKLHKGKLLPRKESDISAHKDGAAEMQYCFTLRYHQQSLRLCSQTPAFTGNKTLGFQASPAS